MLDDNSATANSIEIDPFQLQPGEAAQVGEAVAAIIEGSRSRAAKPMSAGEVDIGGDWELRIDFLHGARVHRLTLEQQGANLVGLQRSSGFEGPVAGALRGGMVELNFTTRYEGSTISYLFEGAVHAGQMSGTAALGAASAQNAGIVNKSQFGAGRWSARRVT